MKNCKDCLHYEACKAKALLITERQEKQKDDLIYYDYILSGGADEKCHSFADRSEWVHLPCKPGDRIWYIRNGRVAFRLVSKSGIYSIATGGKLGKTAFLTREEAEKALEGMKSE